MLLLHALLSTTILDIWIKNRQLEITLSTINFGLFTNKAASLAIIIHP